MDFKARLKEERERLGMSQEAFGEALGTTKKTQYGYEKGTGYPKADYLISASEMGVDVQYVLTGKRTSPHDNSDAEQILYIFNKMSVTGKSTFQQIALALQNMDKKQTHD